MIDTDLLNEYLKNNDISHTFVANLIGEKQQTVSAWFSRKNIPKSKQAMLFNALKLDIKDFISINGVVLQQKIDNNIVDSSIITVQYVTVSADAGTGAYIDTLDDIRSTKSISIMKDGIKYNDQKALKAIPVDGKSMLPTLMPDDTVIIDTTIRHYAGDDLYVLNYAGSLLVKRLQYYPSENKVNIISDNKAYETYSISLSEDQSSFIIIGKVVAIISK